MVASARSRPVVPPTVQSTTQANDPRHPRWVLDVLPFATSLIVHLSILAVGIALYQVVTQVKPKEVVQVTIPDSAMLPQSKLPPGKIANTSLNILLPETNQPPADMGGTANSLPSFPDSAGGPSDNNSLFTGIHPSNAQSGIGNLTGQGPGTGPFHVPQRGGGVPGAGIEGVYGKGKNVIFLCDASGSMLGVFGSLKKQMKDSINRLDILAGAEFNVIFFSDDNCFPLFKDGMQMATAENKQKAMDFVDNAVSTGGTQPLPAIKFAMAEKPDLLFVLTDGFDQIANFDDVVNAFKDGNKDRKMQINCIFLESDPDPQLEKVLKQIVDDGHGTYKKIRKDDM